MKTYLLHSQVIARVVKLAEKIEKNSPGSVCFPIPRGGVPIAYLLSNFMDIEITDNPQDADFFVDDLIDSGVTRHNWCNRFHEIPFYAAYDKQVDNDLGWIVFPWEGTSEGSASDIPTRLLQYIGEDPKRGGLIETPERFLKAWDFMTSGYNSKPADILKVFEDGSEGYDEMVVVKDIPFYSQCEHHLLPFFGTATIGYIPKGKIVGLSKLSRLLDIYARRLQVQERLTKQVADSIMGGLDALGCGVIIKARHLCMEARGVCQQGHHTVTSSLLGVMRDQAATRNEFMLLAK